MLRNLVISLILGCSAIYAFSASKLEIVYSDGSSHFYIIDEATCIKFEGDSALCIESASATEKLQMANFSFYRYITENAFISELEIDGLELFTVDNGYIRCKIADTNSEIRVYAINGELVAIFNAVKNIENRFSLRQLPSGIYIVSLNNKSVKILL